MIKLFTIRQPIVFLLLVALVFALRLPALLFNLSMPLETSAYTCFGDFFYLLNKNKLIGYSVGGGIMVLQTLHLNHIFEKHTVHHKITYLPSLFYIIYASLFNILDCNITPALLAQTPLMLVLNIYFDLYKTKDIGTKIFAAMFILGLGALLYFPLALLLPVFLINLFFIKIPSFRDFMVAIAGAILPIYFAFVYYYFNGQYDFFMAQVNKLTLFKTHINIEETSPQLWLLVVLGVMVIMASFKLYLSYFKNIIKTRIIQQMLFVLSFVSLFVLTFLLQFQYQHLLIFLIPMSFILSYFFMGKWKLMLNEMIAIALLFFILFLKINKI